MTTAYGDISPRTAAFAATTMLARALPYLCMAKYGQMQSIPKNKSQTVKFRRYNAWAPSVVPLVEGVTPAADELTHTDVSATLSQYGRRTVLTDVVMDTHEDPVLAEVAEILGEVAGQTQETIVYNAIKAGTNVVYANGAARNAVNTAVASGTLKTVIRKLKRQNTRMITKMLAATDKVSTQPIPPCFVAFCHPDLEKDLQAIANWVRVQNYGTWQPLGESEIGAFENLRFLTSTLYTPFLGAGGAVSSGAFVSNGADTGTVADVYPIIVVGKDAYATVALAGSTAVHPIILNPKPSDSDPMAQRGHAAFKMYSTACILNDAWMVRAEVACTV